MIAALEAENVRLRAAMSRLLEGLDKHDVHDYCEALQQARQALAQHPAEASEQHPDASQAAT